MPASPVATPAEITPDRRPYQPFGACLELIRAREPEVLISGPAGTGKSLAALVKLHACAEKYAGVRALMVRKTRASLTESALVTYEEKMVPVGHPVLNGASRGMRQAYHYPNGSTIVLGGMDKPSKVMSTEYDLIYVQEAIELNEGEWEALSTRLRNGAMPYQQILGDTNPDSPHHWLKRRCDFGKTRILFGKHEDNPSLWDVRAGQWTPFGEVYLSKLDALSGPRRDRLRFGRWVQAEGVVYEGWNPAHLIDRFPIPAEWSRYWCIDFGYTAPFVCQFWAEDPDGRLYRYREIYHTQRLVEDHAKQMAALAADEPRPRAIICDHDAEDRATLERHLQMGTAPAYKAVSPGIQAVASRLRAAGDSKPRIFFLRDSLVERDSILLEARKPTCTEEEFDGYIWDQGAGRRKGEEPVKKDDHGMDAMRYLVGWLEGTAMRHWQLDGREMVLWPPVRDHLGNSLANHDPDARFITVNGVEIDMGPDREWWESP